MPNVAIFKYTEDGLDDEKHEIQLIGRKEFTYYANTYSNGRTEQTLVTAVRLDDGFWSDEFNSDGIEGDPKFEVWMML